MLAREEYSTNSYLHFPSSKKKKKKDLDESQGKIANRNICQM